MLPRSRRFGSYYCTVLALLFVLPYYNPIPWDKIVPFRTSSEPDVIYRRPGRAPPVGVALVPDPLVGAEEPPKPNSAPRPVVPEEALPDFEDDPVSDSGYQRPSSASSANAASLEDKLAVVEQLMLADGDGLNQPAGHNRKALEDLTRCIYDHQCPKQPKLVIIASDPIHKSALSGPHHNRLRAILQALDDLKIFYVFSPKDIGWAESVHALFAEQTKLVLFDKPDLRACLDDTFNCVRSDENPTGIPAWKMVAWAEGGDGDAPSPFGHAWTFTYEQTWGGQSFVGFSFPDTCKQIVPFVDPTQREDRAPEFFEKVGAETGTGFVASLHPTIGRLKDYPNTVGHKAVPDNLVELGDLNERKVLTEMSKSRLLVGLWDPRFEDVVLEALCLGVPFLNPIHQWNKNEPTDRRGWVTQNMELNWLGPPRVMRALANPIETAGYIPPHLTHAALMQRVEALVDRDWQQEAKNIAAKQGITGFAF
ncbi:hypothetical protein MKEN_01405400 [Mycena kentingensis (nom. inval.)]|nr:hypothetical protein MKEN_01405400 [Mycena kentingensis (nom. inval.)]